MLLAATGQHSDRGMPRWHPSFFPFPFVSPWVTRRKKKHCAYKWVLIYFCMRDACKYTLDTTNGRILCFSLDSGQIWEMRGGKMRRSFLKSTIDSEGGGRIFWRSKKKYFLVVVVIFFSPNSLFVLFRVFTFLLLSKMCGTSLQSTIFSSDLLHHHRPATRRCCFQAASSPCSY